MKSTNVAIGYSRVSTKRQGDNGCSLAIQRALIDYYAELQGLQVIDHYEDVQSGKGDGLRLRPGLQAAIARAEQNGAILIVQDVSRLTRDEDTARELGRRGVQVHSAMNGGQLNDVALAIQARHAELHREAISERTANALAPRKGTGELGNHHNLAEARAKGVEANRRAADEFVRAIAPKVERIMGILAQRGPVSLSRIARGLNECKIRTRRHGAWTPQAVKLLLERMARLDEPTDFASW